MAHIIDIDAQRAARGLPKMQVIDVRQPEEYNGPLGHIPGSRSIPLTELAQRVSELDPESDTLVVCRSGQRSQSAARALAQAGFRRVFNLTGGMRDWRAQGLPARGVGS